MPKRKPPSGPPQAGGIQGEPPLPLDYMLAVMGDESADPARRDEMARLAAPYLHAKAESKAQRKGGKAGKAGTTGAEGEDDSDAHPIIRTARASLTRKLDRLAARGKADPPA